MRNFAKWVAADLGFFETSIKRIEITICKKCIRIFKKRGENEVRLLHLPNNAM